MNRSNGRQGNLYDQVLDYARREIDEASSKVEELRRTLRLLEARVEAAKAVYESVAARLNLEDELEDEADFQAVSYPDTPPPAQAPEPPEEEVESEVFSGNGNQDGFSMDLIRRHLEAQAKSLEPEEVSGKIPKEVAEEIVGKTPEAKAEPAGEGARGSGFPELSEAERRLIEEHMRSRAEAERRG